jgi:hypothetical protein
VRAGLFGSTANGVLDAADVPVVVIREADTDVKDSPDAVKLAGVR